MNLTSGIQLPAKLISVVSGLFLWLIPGVKETTRNNPELTEVQTTSGDECLIA